MSLPRHSFALHWRPVMLPPEHGSWSLVLEPLVLALAVAPSWAGLLIALAALFAFLAYRPLKLAVGDFRRRKRYPRTLLARYFSLTFGTLALAAVSTVIVLVGTRPLLALLAAAPLAALFVLYDLRPGRAVEAEITAPAALGAVAAAVPLAAGWGVPESFALWAVVAGRAIPSVLYVRERLALGRAESIQPGAVLAAHMLALASALLLSGVGLLPLLAPLAFVPLTLRSWVGLSRFRRPAPAKRIGILEVFWGAMTVVIVTLSYRLW